MNYYEIGQRIRKFRKAMGLSQETLAEQVGISVTHMSHIETGNTKLSLPVLLKVAQTLQVSTDDLLLETPVSIGRNKQEISEILDQCTEKQLRVLTEILRAAKTAMDKYDPFQKM